MIKIKSLVFGSLLLVQFVAASKYGSSGGHGGGGGGSEGLYMSSNGGSSEGQLDLSSLGLAEFAQSGPSYQSAGGASVPAAIQTKRTVEVKPVNIPQEPVEPHIVDVEATYQPVHVVFRSSSSPVMVQQIHTPAQPNQVESTQSEDTPHRVQHSVIRPVIQEVREIITPYRRVLQEIRPVQESVRTIVAKNSNDMGRSAAVGQSGDGQSQGSGLGAYSSGSGGAAGAYASASAASPSYSTTRGRRSSSIRVGQRKSYRRAAARRAQQQAIYASLRA